LATQQLKIVPFEFNEKKYLIWLRYENLRRIKRMGIRTKGRYTVYIERLV